MSRSCQGQESVLKKRPLPNTPTDKDDTRSEGDVKLNLLKTHYASNPQRERGAAVQKAY